MTKVKSIYHPRIHKLILCSILLTSFSIISCGKSSGGSSSGAVDDLPPLEQISNSLVETDDAVTGTVGTNGEESSPSPVTITPNSNIPALALSFSSDIDFMNLNAAQKTKYNRAVSMVKKVVATEAFRKKVLNYRYSGKTQFADNRGRTNAQIYQSILDAAESLRPAKNNTMDVGVKVYYQNSSVVGYTSPSITYINVNTKFFNAYSVNEVAGNLFHEWLHKLGYTHDASATAKRPYTVPYAIGYMVRDLGKSFL